jgi:hypothetical protein
VIACVGLILDEQSNLGVVCLVRVVDVGVGIVVVVDTMGARRKRKKGKEERDEGG